MLSFSPDSLLATNLTPTTTETNLRGLFSQTLLLVVDDDQDDFTMLERAREMRAKGIPGGRRFDTNVFSRKEFQESSASDCPLGADRPKIAGVIALAGKTLDVVGLQHIRFRVSIVS